MDPHVDNEEGYGTATLGKKPEGKYPIHRGPIYGDALAVTPDNTPDGGLTGVVTERRPDHRPPALTPAGRDLGSGTRPEVEPSHQLAGTADGTSFASRAMTGRSEGHAGLAGPPSAQPPDRQSVASSQPVDTVRGRGAGPAAPAVPPGSKQRPAVDRAQVAAGTSFWSPSDPVWDNGGFLVKQAKETLRSLQGGTRDLSAGMLRGGSLTQRGLPLRAPSPFSGFGLVMGAAAAGSASSSDGSAPLLAVLFSCLFALLLRDWFRAYRAFLRPGTVPRLALERPG